MSPSPQKNSLGTLMVVSGPSGCGKTTLCRKLSDQGEAVYSISCTTRKPREGEVHGRDYFFLTEEDFVTRIERGEFFEHAEVHGRRYGTLRSYVTDNLLRGVDVVMDIDVQGAAIVRSCNDETVQRCLVDVFILTPTVEELENRLSARATESPEALALRLSNAIAEMDHWAEYDYTLVSGSREDDLARFKSILVAERMRSTRRLSN
jgi:guanylate kinase